MGLDYSYKLYFKRAQLHDALVALTHYAEPHLPPVQVHFPDKILTLPFDSWGIKDKTIQFDAPELGFDLVLNFELDDAIEEYIQNRDKEDSFRAPPDEEEIRKVGIGYIYLTIYTDLSERYPGRQPPDLVLFDFGTTGTHMSLLFGESVSIRNTFSELLEKVPGVCGVFDREMDVGELFWLKGERLSEELSDVYALPDELLIRL